MSNVKNAQQETKIDVSELLFEIHIGTIRNIKYTTYTNMKDYFLFFYFVDYYVI